MKKKHLDARIAQCLTLAEMESPCPRRKLAALVVDPVRNQVLVDAWNGGPRGIEGHLCGGDVCDRDEQNIESGTHMEIGCHHSELNAICNAAYLGIPLKGAWMICPAEPCLMCAKYGHHAGIAKFVIVNGGYLSPGKGLAYLDRVGIPYEFVEGPKDPRIEGAGAVPTTSGSSFEAAGVEPAKRPVSATRRGATLRLVEGECPSETAGSSDSSTTSGRTSCPENTDRGSKRLLRRLLRPLYDYFDSWHPGNP